MDRPTALVVHAHPSTESFNHHLARLTVDALDSTHDTEFLDLYRCGFSPEMTAEELDRYQTRQSVVDPVVASHIELIEQAETLAFVYPTWWYGVPAMLKGWLEKTMVPGVAFEFDSRGRVRPALSSVKRIVGVTTYGSPQWKMRLVGDGGRRTIHRALRLNVPHRVAKVWLGMHAIDTSTAAERAAFADQVNLELRSM